MSKKAAFIIRRFNDAGTGNAFARGAIVEIDEGAFQNYAAAGLVREPTEAELKSSKEAEAVVDTGASADASPTPATPPPRRAAKA